MASKALFALVVVLLPFTVANSVTLAGRGFTAVDVARTVAAGLPVQALLSGGLLALGVLTRRFSRAVVALVLLVAWVAAVSWALVIAKTAWHLEAVGGTPAADVAAVTIALASAAAVMASAYRRRPRSAVALAVAGPALALGALHLLPWGLEPAPPLPASVELRVAATDRWAMGYVQPARAARYVHWNVLGELRPSGVPSELSARAAHVESDVSWADGRREAARILSMPEPIAGEAGERLTVQGLGTVSNLRSSVIHAAAVSPGTWESERGSGGTARATARVRLLLTRHRLVARMPLRADAHWRSGSERILLKGLSLLEPVRVRVHETGLYPGVALHVDLPPRDGVGGTYRYYAFHSPSTHELLAARFGAAPSNVPPVASGLRLMSFDVEPLWPNDGRWRDPSARTDWLAGAELLKIEATVVAAGERTVELTGLRLPARADAEDRAGR
jgi:hypothetical protein